MPNTPIDEHPLIGKSFVYRADGEPYIGEVDSNLVVANGMCVTVLAAFTNWNDVEGLEILAVKVPDTGYTTHATPSDLGLSSLAQH